MKSSEKQNRQAEDPIECKYMEKTATLLRSFPSQVPAWNTIKPQKIEKVQRKTNEIIKENQ